MKTPIKQKYIGLESLSVEGSSFETGFGISKFVNLKMNEKLFKPALGVIMNTFGVEHKDRIKEKIFCSLKEKNKFLEFYCKSADVEAPRWIVGAPTLRIGNGIWSPHSNFYLGKIKDYKKIQTAIEFKSFCKKGFYDFSYDLWFTENKNQQNSTFRNDLEIMIVVDSNFKFPNKGKETSYNGMRVVYHEKKPGPNRQDKAGWEVSFIVPKDKPNFSFDILELVKFVSKILNKDFSRHYINSMDIIAEFAAKSEAKIELHKLDFDFLKKR